MIDNYSQLQEELEKYISKDSEIEEINLVYFFAKKAHDGQFRKSGEPYIIHPINVAFILAKLGMPVSVIKAGLLHDVVEDCDVTYQEIEFEFGKVIADIVEGVTKIGELNFESIDDQKAANHHKLLIAMAKDIRVIIVKLADRLHNLMTLDSMTREKQKNISNETLEIYAPIAHKLGMYQMK